MSELVEKRDILDRLREAGDDPLLSDAAMEIEELKSAVERDAKIAAEAKTLIDYLLFKVRGSQEDLWSEGQVRFQLRAMDACLGNLAALVEKQGKDAT